MVLSNDIFRGISRGLFKSLHNSGKFMIICAVLHTRILCCLFFDVVNVVSTNEIQLIECLFEKIYTDLKFFPHSPFI